MAQPSDRGPRPRDREANEDAAQRPPKRAVQGTIREALPNAMYTVELDDSRKILCHVASSLQTRTVRVLPGDRVTVEVSPYDPQRGRITQRHR